MLSFLSREVNTLQVTQKKKVEIWASRDTDLPLHYIIVRNSTVQETKVKLQLPSCLLRWVFFFFEGKRAEPQVKMFNQLLHSPWDKVVCRAQWKPGFPGCVWPSPQINAAFLLKLTMRLFCGLMLSSRGGFPPIELIVQPCQQVQNQSFILLFLSSGVEHNVCYDWYADAPFKM